ncbi:MAG: hypothetical protein M3Y13_04730 [Armatimonadota bacterium]|nr:hypothetical protein [Armatimonadota bacterium]
MTLTIELSPEEEARLQAQARRQGQNIQDRAHDLVRAGLGVLPAADVTEEQHAVLVQRLRDAGLLTELPTRPLGPPPPFITVLGPPVSQTLLEDRE